MAGYLAALLTKLVASITKASIRVRVSVIAVAIVVALAVSFALGAPSHVAVLAIGQAWGK